VGHDDLAGQLLREDDGDRGRGPLSAGDDGMGLLDELLGRPPGDEHPAQSARDRPNGGTRPHESARGLERVLPELHGVDEGFERLLREPAGAVLRIGGDVLDAFGKLGVHARSLPRIALAPNVLMVAWRPMAEPEIAPQIAPDPAAAALPAVSLVVPVYNEEGTLEQVCGRAVAVLESLGKPFELIVVDDGSRDGTWGIVERLAAADARIRAVRFKKNFGQHPAMHAGLVRARGEIVVTMDADLQNVPEDLPRLIAAVEGGTDVASGRRVGREDSWGRTLPSRLVNGMLRRFTGVDVADFGCAFNAYSRSAVEPVLGVIGKQKFTKALVLSAGASVVEVDLTHQARADSSRYSLFRLIRLALHVLAGFWPQPIQWAGVTIGAACGLLTIAVGVWGIAFWVVQGDFPGLLFLGGLVLGVLAVQGFILALVGEYLGRIQRDVEGRPLYTIDRELGDSEFLT
jgi:undecaprenyl-phosphate 4-deoxy-4-formamido-L-arabinose transferase